MTKLMSARVPLGLQAYNRYLPIGIKYYSTHLHFQSMHACKNKTERPSLVSADHAFPSHPHLYADPKVLPILRLLLCRCCTHQRSTDKVRSIHSLARYAKWGSLQTAMMHRTKQDTALSTYCFAPTADQISRGSWHA